MWLLIVLGLAGMAFMYAAGRFDWLRFERRKVEAAAEERYRRDGRAVATQLTRAERALAERAEDDHVAAHDPRAWRDNGAGYLSRTAYDSPARVGGVTPNKEINEDAKVG